MNLLLLHFLSVSDVEKDRSIYSWAEWDCIYSPWTAFSGSGRERTASCILDAAVVYAPFIECSVNGRSSTKSFNTLMKMSLVERQKGSNDILFAYIFTFFCLSGYNIWIESRFKCRKQQCKTIGNFNNPCRGYFQYMLCIMS